MPAGQKTSVSAGDRSPRGLTQQARFRQRNNVIHYTFQMAKKSAPNVRFFVLANSKMLKKTTALPQCL